MRKWLSLNVLCCFLLIPRLFSAEVITPGLRYEHRQTGQPLSIHILEIDPKKVTIAEARALNDGIGRETVSSIAARRGALAATNGGFFRIGGRLDGEPEGILRVRSQWYSDADLPRGAIGWSFPYKEAWISRLTMKWSLDFDGVSYPVDGFNRPRGEAEAVLYNWVFHRSTLTDPGGHETIILGKKVVFIGDRGDTAIPANAFVYSTGPKSPARVTEISRNSTVNLSYRIEQEGEESGSARDWDNMNYIVGGTPVLIREGRIVEDFEAEKVREGFIKDRHPRTAVGLRADGTWVLAVVDGRQPALSVGMTLSELAEFMKSLGCISALNLDGGGSSTMVVRGKVLNSPSDAAGERPVSDAIIFLPR